MSIDSPKPLKELYPVSYGPLALREALIKCGNLEQGGCKSETVLVANTSGKQIKVESELQLLLSIFQRNV